MDQYESNRRKFIRSLGLSVGAVMTVNSVIKAGVSDNKEKFEITPEQEEFIIKYEKWMDDFIDVIRVQKISPNNLDNNKKLIRLTEIAKEWQQRLTEFMKDENFARYYIVVTERMTQEIE